MRERRRLSERERAFKLFKWQCSEMLSMLKAKAIKALSTFILFRERERETCAAHAAACWLPATCCKLQAAAATAARLLSGEQTQVLVNSLAHKNAST